MVGNKKVFVFEYRIWHGQRLRGDMTFNISEAKTSHNKVLFLNFSPSHLHAIYKNLQAWKLYKIELFRCLYTTLEWVNESFLRYHFLKSPNKSHSNSRLPLAFHIALAKLKKNIKAS